MTARSRWGPPDPGRTGGHLLEQLLVLRLHRRAERLLRPAQESLRDHNTDQLPTAWTPITARYTAIGRAGRWPVRGARRRGGPLGWRTSDDRVLPDGGTAVVLQRGRLSWSARTGARETLDAIATAYASTGAEAGPLGFPTSHEYAPSPGVRRNDLERGTITHDEATGSTTV